MLGTVGGPACQIVEPLCDPLLWLCSIKSITLGRSSGLKHLVPEAGMIMKNVLDIMAILGDGLRRRIKLDCRLVKWDRLPVTVRAESTATMLGLNDL